ncbi:MAG: glycosyltransferase [Candidatus Nomurabacteria bacterium]|jgi:glycosyltransferase involved in cell wall biosynthesis|nr:glycosyltransferase [Candidatus Nomurabacteria bacterium]
MNIVISSDLYYPMIDGVAAFSFNLAHGLAKLGHNVVVLAPSITGDFVIENDKQFRVVRLPSIRVPFYPDQIEQIPEARTIFGHKIPQIAYKNGIHVSFYPYNDIQKFLDAFHPDIIHNQTPGPIALSVYRYAKKRHIPIVATGHSYPENLTAQLKFVGVAKRPLNAVVRKFYTSFLTRAEYATMPTELAVRDLAPKKRLFREPPKPIEPLSNGVDLSRFHPAPAPKSIYKKYQIPTNKPIVLYVGRLDAEKSLSVAIRAFAKLLTKIPNAHFVIVGDGNDKSNLEKLAHRLKISDSVQFTGKILGLDLPKVYRTANVFVITSTTETQSIVLIEALASGLPAVAVQAGALPELVQNQQNGFLVPPDDPTATADALAIILNNPKLARKMSKYSLKIAKNHDLRHTLARLIAIYTDVIKNF